MQKHELKVSKTARYFTKGILSENTKEIWFVLHGYAQTAEDFLESLDGLNSETRYIIAPEALSRFYWKDFTNNPVASWMTKTDREVDIADNIEYLNNLYFNVLSEIKNKEVEIKFLGFSQGAATLSRWLYDDKVKSTANYFYAGELAHELDFSKSSNFRNAKNFYIYGSKDFFIDTTKLNRFKEDFLDKNLNLNIFTFEGKHQIHQDAVSFILNN